MRVRVQVLIKEPLLSAYPMINVHPSLLPRWRGAAPVERAIMAGDEETGVSIMRVTEGLDSGAPCLQEAEPIRLDDDYGTLAAASSGWAESCWCERSTSGRRSPSRTSRRSHTRTRSRPPTAPSTPALSFELERTVRALRPHIGARLALPDGDFLGVVAARSG